MKKILTVMAMALMVALCVVGVVACNPTKEIPPAHDPGTKLEQYDMSGVTFEDKTVTYTGEAQTVTVSGTLPTGLSVAYEHFSGETKLESAPVNAGTYKVVAKFTGDDKHEAVADKTATLTIEKADLDVVLGAKAEMTDTGSQPLETPIEFTKNDDGSFTHQYDGRKYIAEVLSCNNADVDILTVEFFSELNEDGTVDEDSRTTGQLSSELGSALYVRITADEDELDTNNFNATLLTSLTVGKRVVELATAADLAKLSGEINGEDAVSPELRLNTKYVLTADIDLNGAAWKTVGTVITGVNSFNSEFDGQGHTISNFKINENSVEESLAGDFNGVAFGFFGNLNDTAHVYIHDVVFTDIKVELLYDKLLTRGYVYNWTDNFGGTQSNPIYFGVVAGAVRESSDIVVENITVERLEAEIDVYKFYYGTIFGSDMAITTLENARKNLVVNDITVHAVERHVSDHPDANVNIGGLAGELLSWGGTTKTYVDCHVSNLTLVSGNDTLTDYNYESWVGGLFGTNRSNGNILKDCSVKNFRLENWTTGEYTGVYCGRVYSEPTYYNCTASNDADGNYGVFNYTYNSSTESWDEDKVDWEATLPENTPEADDDNDADGDAGDTATTN